jgi:hypothetical protein
MKATRGQNLPACRGRFRRLAVAKIGLCLAPAVVFPGCARLGPRSIPVDRFDYSTSIANSWKQQTLLNVVKLRGAICAP